VTSCCPDPSPGQHAEQLRCACSGRDPESQQRPVPVRAERGEQLIELAVRDLPRDPLSHPRPEQPGSLPAELIHRIVMRVRPSGPGQRERIHQRARPGLQVKVIKRPCHRLAVRDRRRRVLRARRRLPRHPVRHRDTRPDPGRVIITTPMPAAWLARHPHPADEIPRLHTRRLIPGHLSSPQKQVGTTARAPSSMTAASTPPARTPADQRETPPPARPAHPQDLPAGTARTDPRSPPPSPSTAPSSLSGPAARHHLSRPDAKPAASYPSRKPGNPPR
jgi:hypothetical protein